MILNQRLLTCILDLGEILLTSGAEISRVEDTMKRMALAYGFMKVDVFSITSSIVVTVHTDRGEVLTQTRRIMQYDTDLDKIEKVNCISRQVCNELLPVQELQKTIEDIRLDKGYPEGVLFLFYGIISAAFSLFFGGTVLDAAAAFLCGLLLRFILNTGVRVGLQNLVLNFLCSAAVGLGAVVITRFGLGQNIDKIIIGNIMLLIPGLLFTTSLRDMINGDLITGLLGLCDAVLRALAIALGFAVIMLQLGGGML